MTRRTIERRSFTEPDLARSFPHGSGVVARVGAPAVGRTELEPGWRWSADLQPTVGTPSCPSHHVHVSLAGRFVAQMDGAGAEEFAPGDVFDVPPGHDAWVVGDTPVVLLDLSGNVADFGLPTAHGRVLATILFTDIVSATPLEERLGDARWKQLLGRHDPGGPCGAGTFPRTRGRYDRRRFPWPRSTRWSARSAPLRRSPRPRARWTSRSAWGSYR